MVGLDATYSVTADCTATRGESLVVHMRLAYTGMP
jgi:hypothetical protein